MIERFERRGLAVGVSFLVMAALLGLTVEAAAAVGESGKLVPSVASEGDHYGRAVALEGGVAVVGAPWSDGDNPDSGAVHVFVQSGSVWSEQARLYVEDGPTLGLFGSSVAISGDTLVVGAQGVFDISLPSGAAYVFVRSGDTWSQQERFIADNGEAYDSFGRDVAICGDTVVVGDPEGGVVHVFVRSGGLWSQQATLTASDGVPGDNFGREVAIDGDTVIIGAQMVDVPKDNAGAAYVFVRSGITWTEQARLAPADIGRAHKFGSAVAIRGDMAVVGASGDPRNGRATGSAYVFGFSGGSWSQEAKLISESGDYLDSFGESVAIGDDNTIVVGSPYDDVSAVKGGAIFVFTRVGGEWYQQARLVGSDTAKMDYLGRDIAVSGDVVVGGAPFADDAGYSSGAAIVFDAGPGCAGAEATILGTVGDDVLVGTSGDDVIDGLSGDDVIDGAGGNDLICGGAGNDTLTGGAGEDLLDGGDGTDTVSYVLSPSGVVVDLVSGSATGHGRDTVFSIENLWGSDSRDVLIGDHRNNQILGGGGNDRIAGGAGDDLLNGQAGVDTADYRDGVAGVVVSLFDRIATGGLGDDVVRGFENILGSSFDDILIGTNGRNRFKGGEGDDEIYGLMGRDKLLGQGGSDVLIGNAGNDLLFGGKGQDLLLGGPDNDYLTGGSGSDAASFEFSPAGVIADLVQGTVSGEGTDILAEIEDLIGSNYGDRLTGDAGDNALIGLLGDDQLVGLQGDDLLMGNQGDDTYDGGSGIDYAAFIWSAVGVVADLHAGTATGEGTDTLLSIEWAQGTDFDDVLRGNAADNSLWGGKGRDTLKGRAGDDYLNGGVDWDRLDGGSGEDRCINGENLLRCELDRSKNGPAIKSPTRLSLWLTWITSSG